jgi:hypothetical protein
MGIAKLHYYHTIDFASHAPLTYRLHRASSLRRPARDSRTTVHSVE